MNHNFDCCQIKSDILNLFPKRKKALVSLRCDMGTIIQSPLL